MGAVKEKPKIIQVRTTQLVKDRLAELTELMSKRLGTTISQSQAVEMIISASLEREKSEI